MRKSNLKANGVASVKPIQPGNCLEINAVKVPVTAKVQNININ